MERYQFTDAELMLLEQLPNPLAVYQFVGRQVYTLALSDGFREMFGYEDKAEAYRLMNQDPCHNTHPDDVARIEEAIRRFITESGKYEVIFRGKKHRGEDYRVVHCIGKHIYKDGTRLAYVAFTDEGTYTEKEDARATTLSKTFNDALHQESIIKASYYDYLTGLPSMSYFFELAETGKEKIRQEGGNPVLMYIDFVGMKFFNSKNGFTEGDRLLQAFAKLLAEAFGSYSSCRISADHFLVQTEEEGLSNKLQHLFRDCGNINGGKNLPIHVGIYVAQPIKVHTSVACDRAKLACEALRGRYETAVEYYSQELSDDVESRQYVIENINKAIDEKWIKVYYQPIVRAVNGRVCDEEALARWIDPVRGFMSPAEFIPALEDAGLIYKLDLYVLEQVLEKMAKQADMGLYVVPHSVNLSRSDFDVCDIVEEVRKRVDASGMDRGQITIEVTESVIGSDFDFMKAQVERFRALGFQVWMDDFGSGYSSLDVLQSIKFDLIKFDMSFMRKLDEGDSGKIILTELMKMATALGVDTVCEGVETQSQVNFLREIGCSKLQGFYFCKAIPLEEIVERYRRGIQIGYENPDESGYFEAMGRINLYDLAVVANEEVNAFQNSFNTIPMGIIEVNGEKSRFVRSNQSYRNFCKGFFGVDLANVGEAFHENSSGFMQNVERLCRGRGIRTLYDEKMPDGSVVHSFARRIGTNPVTGSIAVAVAVLSISEPSGGETYADIAQALAADYYNIYLIDLDTNDYIEYTSKVGEEDMSLERHGGDFFESARRDTMTRIYEEDREQFLALFTKENVLRDIDRQGVFTTTYRLIDTGKPMYVNMKVTRMNGRNRLILGVSIIDAHMKQQEEEKRLRQEKESLGRIAALSPNYMVLYTVDPVTGKYTQYSPSSEFEKFGLASQGEDFFTDVVSDAPKAIAPKDMERHLRVMTRENMLRDIRNSGVFIHHYRMIMDGRIVPTSLKATLIKESDGEKIILGVTKDAE